VGFLQLVEGLREWRGSARAGDDEELEAGERLGDLVEAAVGDGDLEILVLPPVAAQEQVDRPAGGDVPGCLDSDE
jgi:hypothetical protein